MIYFLGDASTFADLMPYSSIEPLVDPAIDVSLCQKENNASSSCLKKYPNYVACASVMGSLHV